MCLRRVVLSMSLLFTISAGRAAAQTPLPAGDVRVFTSVPLGLTVVSGEVPLPRGGWEVTAVNPAGALEQVHLSPRGGLQAEQEEANSRRQRQSLAVESGRQAMLKLSNPWAAFPGWNAGRKPTSLTEAIDDLKKRRPQEYDRLRQQVLERSPYPDAATAGGPYFFFPPDVAFLEQGTRWTQAEVKPLALELRPWLDDGRHWVLFNNLRVERREIDRELLAAHGVAVRPILAGVRDNPGPEQQPLHVLRGIMRDPEAREVRVTLRDAGTGAAREVAWNLAGATAGDAALTAAWSRDRARGWRLLAAAGGAPVYSSWLALSDKLYGSVPPEPGARPPHQEVENRRRGDFDRSTDAFGILGGRAALEETLQMQLLGTGPRPPDDLVAWWGFDDCDGRDSSRRALAASVVGTPACIPGAQGMALYLDGGAHLKLEHLSTSGEALSVAAWVRLGADIVATETYLVSRESQVKEARGRGKSPGPEPGGTRPMAKSQGWGLGIYGSGHREATGNSPAFHYSDGDGGTVECVAAGTTLAPGRWYHIAATTARDKVTLFVDGAAVKTCELKQTLGWTGGPLGIGRAPDGDAESVVLNGAIDEVRIYQRTLAAAEVSELFSPRTAPIPIAEIPGVEVKSHPFAELLAGKDGVRLAIADAVPADRFLLWFAKPAAVFPFLEDGADFLFRAGSLATKSWVDDDLKGRYLRRLGLGEKLGRKFLESGEVVELAIAAPDLFFIDGTDLTLLMRVRRPDKAVARLKDLGVAAPPADGVGEKQLGGGRSAWWAIRGDLILAGTSRTELQACLDLLARGGEGSLGRSAELRYMLSRQEPGVKTRAVAYFSDSFVRRLTGPAVKIGQLRRMRDRAQAVQVTAGALLCRLDRGREERDLARLEELGYTPKGLAAQGWRLREDLAAVSPAWGTLADADTLGAHPVEAATPEEAKLYKLYVDQYARYWRQYFDPIAVRLDDAAGGELALSVFILPLLESQLYGQVREMIAGAASQAPLRVPRFEPEPVLQLSLNVKDEGRQRWANSLGGMLARYTGLDSRLFDLLGPGFHFAIRDADPILALGNGDVLGAFGSLGVGRGGEGFGIPTLLSVLTRPCTFAIELRDPAAALAVLRKSLVAEAREGRRRGLRAEFRQVGEQDAWVLTLNAAGFVRLRFGIEVRQGYLVVNNLPWSGPLTMRSVEEEPLRGAALRVASGSVRLGLPGLYATQQEQNQAAALKGIAALQPLLATGAGDPAAAMRRCAALFGSTPLHPAQGEWRWRDGRLSSSAYGDAARWRQPPWREGAGDFGVLEGVSRLAVRMQFEDTGLRTLFTWTTTK